MPELPEVETVRSVLEKRYLHKILMNVEVLYPSLLANINKEEFEEALKGQEILSIKRKGKFLIFLLSSGTLLSHLRMEGKYKFERSLQDKHTHCIFTFEDGSVLLYHDVRKFGRFYYFPLQVDYLKEAPLNKIGPEPWEIKNSKELYDSIHSSTLPIKVNLMNQTIIAGIGNIYADEICFECKINPLTSSKKVSKKECEKIVSASKKILQEAILDGGSTIKTFQSAHGVDGLFQQKLKVYGRQNEECVVCHTQILKTRVGGRGTHYCPNCQRKKR